MKNNRGFTLIELIIVIVILGILAVTAAPKFLDIQGDANTSTMQGVDGALNGGMSLVYGKAVIAGMHKADSDTDVGISTDSDVALEVLTAFGYPTAVETNFEAFLDIALNTDGSTGDFDVVIGTDLLYIIPNGTDNDTTAEALATNCYVLYNEASSADVAATTTLVTTGC